MFGIADYSAFCATILLFLALPGPGTFVLLASTSQGGFRAGAAATLGLILGDQVLLWLAVGGLAALLVTHPALFGAVQYAGAAYLGWTGLRLIFSKPGSAPPLRAEARHGVRRAFFITLLNPKAIVFYMAFFPLFITPATHRGAITFAAMAGTIAGITAVYCLLLCAVARALGTRLRGNGKVGRWLQRAAGVFLLGFGIRLAAS